MDYEASLASLTLRKFASQISGAAIICPKQRYRLEPMAMLAILLADAIEDEAQEKAAPPLQGQRGELKGGNAH